MLFENFENTTRNSIYKGDLPNNKIYCTSVKKGKKDILILLFIITIKLLEYLMFLLLQIMILIIFKY